ncbi:MAG: DUF1330 domain-containing protein [Phenylobacterium sp.]|uniref:DUF1330 domain-containing protein n=1 Tax=Phenylobacterium sp. TaxID=1871053 RepID=UPI003919F36F
MTAYVVAQITIRDRARYDRYVAGFMPVLQRHSGRLLVADEAAQVMEGDWDRQKLIVLAFPDQEAALAWSRSPDYQAIAVDRLAASDGVVLLAQGVD